MSRNRWLLAALGTARDLNASVKLPQPSIAPIVFRAPNVCWFAVTGS